MFAYAYDEEKACALFLFTGKSNDDADFVRYLASIDDLDVRARGRSDAAIITLVEEGNPPPNAKWRRAIGEQSSRTKTRPVGALVSSSPLIRGVVTVLDWLAPKRFEQHVAVATFEEAIVWIEARRGPRRAVFVALRERARAAAREQSRPGG